MMMHNAKEADSYLTIDKPSTAEYKDRGSRFIAFAFPVTDTGGFREKMAGIKSLHPKATHHCFAYRLGTDGQTFRAGDDGEPPGSAGRPILGQIDSRQLTDTLVVVVRYFGGTLLGVPGLIQAYKNAAALALQVTPQVRKPVLEMCRIQFDYTRMNDVMRVLKQFGCPVFKQDNQLFSMLEAGIPRGRKKEVLFKLNEIQGVEVNLLIS